jgi:hypothetical protein
MFFSKRAFSVLSSSARSSADNFFLLLFMLLYYYLFEMQTIAKVIDIPKRSSDDVSRQHHYAVQLKLPLPGG